MTDGIQIGGVDEIKPVKDLTNQGVRQKPLGKGALASPAANPGSGPKGVESPIEAQKKEEKSYKAWNERPENADETEVLKPGEEKTLDIPGEDVKKLVIRMDPETKKLVFEVKNEETGEVIKQIPPEELVELGKKLPEIVKGLIVNNMV